MGLEDKFRPDDGSKIVKFDNFMIAQAEKIGNLYQDKTGRSYKDLLKAGYSTAAVAYGSTVIGNPLLIFFGGPLAIYAGTKAHADKHKSPLEEELQAEFIGWDKNRFRKKRVENLVLSTITAGVGSYMTIVNQEPKASNFFLALTIAGIGGYMHTFSDYLAKTELPPPKKRLRSLKPAYIRIQNQFTALTNTINYI